MELNDIIDLAIKEEIRFQKIYRDTAEMAFNSALKSLLNDLADMEKGHEEKLLNFKNGYVEKIGDVKVQDLKISDYLEDTGIDDKSSIQDVLIYAMKSEAKANELYNRLSGMMKTEESKDLFISLAAEEMGHKNSLEKIYEEHFMPEN